MTDSFFHPIHPPQTSRVPIVPRSGARFAPGRLINPAGSMAQGQVGSVFQPETLSSTGLFSGALPGQLPTQPDDRNHRLDRRLDEWAQWRLSVSSLPQLSRSLSSSSASGNGERDGGFGERVIEDDVFDNGDRRPNSSPLPQSPLPTDTATNTPVPSTSSNSQTSNQSVIPSQASKSGFSTSMPPIGHHQNGPRPDLGDTMAERREQRFDARSPQALPQESSQVLPQAFSQVLPQASSQVLPQASSQVLPQASSQEAPRVLPQEVPQALPQEVPQASSQEVSQVSSQEAPRVLPQEVPQVSSQVLPQASFQEVPQVLPQASSQVLPQASSQEVPQGLPQASSQEVPQGLPQGLPQASSQEVPQVLPQASSQEVPQVLPQASSQEVPQVLPQALPQEVPQVLPQASSQEVPQVLPQALPQEVPQVLPQKSSQVLPQASSQEAPQPFSQTSLQNNRLPPPIAQRSGERSDDISHLKSQENARISARLAPEVSNGQSRPDTEASVVTPNRVRPALVPPSQDGVSSHRFQGSAQRRQSQSKADDSRPTIEISIGRIEVRATSKTPPSKGRKRTRPSGPKVSLSAYLQKRNGAL